MMISIALATYNGEKFLSDQLESFLAQTLRPDELVVCDDNSQDSTWAMLTTFAESSPFPVRLFRNAENLGYGANFAKAVGLATGDLIFMSDQDDVWLPDKLARMAAAFDRPEIMVVTCDQDATDELLRPSGQSVLTRLRAAGAPPVMFTIGCCTALRSSLRQLLLPMPTGITVHDGWLDVLAKSLDVHRTVPEVLQYHRRHGRNASPDHLIPASRVGRIALVRGLFSISPEEKTFLYPYYEAVVQRLEEVPDAEFPLGERRQRALDFARRQLTTLRARHVLAELPRRRRLPGVLRLLRQGHYRQFSGWKSALKDVLVKRISVSR